MFFKARTELITPEVFLSTTNLGKDPFGSIHTISVISVALPEILLK